MAYEFITVERDGPVTVFTLNRPEVMNALHSPAHFELHEAFDGEDKRVLDGVRGLVTVAEYGPAEVVQPVGVTVIDRGERVPVAREYTCHQFGVSALTHR